MSLPLLRVKILLSIVALMVTALSLGLPDKIDGYTQDLTPLTITTSSNRVGVDPEGIEVGLTPKLNISNAEIRVTFDSGWQLASLPSAYTLSTSVLQTFTQPSGLTLTEVTGNTLTFSASNLVADTTYGFRILSGITNPATAGNYSLTLELWNPDSLVASGTTDLTIVNNNQIQVTGQILPQPEQLPFELSILNPKDAYGPGETIEFELSITNTLTYPLPLTLETTWQDSILQSGQLVSLLSYKPGSASGGPSGTTPIYLPASDTLRFEIPSLSVGVSSLRFALITSSFTGSHETISLDLTTSLTNPPLNSQVISSLNYRYPVPTTQSLSGCDQSCTQNSDCQSNYCHPISNRCRNSNNPDSPSCDQPPISSSPSPVPTRLSALQINSLTVQSITSSSITVVTDLNRPATLQIRYGTSPKELTQTLTLPTVSSRHLIQLEALKAQTHYYFQIQSGSFVSELMSVTTAGLTTIHNQPSTMVSSLYLDDQLLSFLTTSPGEFLLPTGGLVGLRVQLPEFADGLSVSLVPDLSGVESSVQGATDPLPSFRLDRVARSLFSGSIPLPTKPGKYQAFAQIHFLDNSFTQIPLAQVTTTTPLQVVDAVSKKPVGEVKIQLEYYEAKASRFIVIDLPKDQITSDMLGNLLIGFGPGKYHVTTQHPLYKPTTHQFTVDTSSENLPVIELESYPAGPFLWLHIQYHRWLLAIVSLSSQLQAALTDPFHSQSLILGVLTLNILALIGAGYHRFRSHPGFLSRLSSRLRKSPLPEVIQATVIDNHSRKPLSQVIVQAVSADNQFIASTTTDRRGQFRLLLENNATVSLTLLHPEHGVVTTSLTPSSSPYSIGFPSRRQQSIGVLKQLLASLAKLSFEFLLVLSFLLQVLLFDQVPLLVLLPVTTITVLGLLTQLTLPTHTHIQATPTHEPN